MHRLGIVDLGSNTARLVAFAFEKGRWLRLIDQLREPIRLGEGLGRDGTLTEEAQRRAETSLALFARYAANTGLHDVEVLGTSALRDAANREQFLDRIRPLGLSVTVLSGEEEARLGVLAAANGFSMGDAWVMDLGGGSAQLSRMEKRGFEEGQAYPLGAVRLTELYLQSDPPKNKEVRDLEQAIAKELAPISQRLRENDLPLIAMGGSIRNLARAVQKRNNYPLPDRLHGYFLERSELEDLTTELLDLSIKKRSRIPGIKSDRADIIVAAALVYRWLVRHGDLDGIWISGYGLREGEFYRHFLPAPHLIDDLRAFSVQNLLQHYAQSKENIEQTRRLAGRLFWSLRPLQGWDHEEFDLLDSAAVLQDVGLAVNYYRHDRHGEYLVASARLSGFTHREQALMSLLVRYHRRGKPSLGKYRSICHSSDKQLLEALVACLRIADHLDRPKSGCVRDIRVDIGSDSVMIVPIVASEPDLELWQLEQHEPVFRSAFDRGLRIGAAEYAPLGPEPLPETVTQM
ncbi:MAG: Ppx/GppA phosphatase family protein [Acidobacteriota bacterium]